MISNTFTVRCVTNGASLTLTQLDEHSLVADLSSPGVRATTQVYQLGAMDGLGEYWQELSSDSRGWNGTRTWAALEGGIALEASIDGTGHVDLRVCLEGALDARWRTDARFVVEAGQLGQLASDALAFAKGFVAAA